MKWAFLTPLFVFLLVWNIGPLLWILGLSFHNFSILTGLPPQYVGVQNYLDLFTNPYFWGRFSITFVFITASVSLETVLGVLLGLFFNRKMKFKGIMIPLLLAPMLITPVASGTFFRFIYDSYWGVATYFLKLMGFEVSILSNSLLSKLAIISVNVWQWTPFIFLMTIAALQTVPTRLKEAALIDRASWWGKFKNVIWPAIRPTIILAVLLRTIDIFRTFGAVFNLTQGGPGNSTLIVPISIYNLAFSEYKTGLSAAFAVVILVMAIGLTSLYLTISRKEEVSHGT